MLAVIYEESDNTDNGDARGLIGWGQTRQEGQLQSHECLNLSCQ